MPTKSRPQPSDQRTAAQAITQQVPRCLAPVAASPDPQFWDQRPILAHIRDFARARRASPWAVLGVVLVRVTVATAPGLRLPPTTGDPAPLNLYAALVGPPGVGKGAASAVAARAVLIGKPRVEEVGSGGGQRDLWLPANDPDAPDVAPSEPEPREWTAPPQLDDPDLWHPVLMRVCGQAGQQARKRADAARLAWLRNPGDSDPLDTPAPSGRLKVAAALALLDSRVDMSDGDWELARRVMAVSDATRAQFVAWARGRSEGERAANADSVRAVGHW